MLSTALQSPSESPPSLSGPQITACRHYSKHSGKVEGNKVSYLNHSDEGEQSMSMEQGWSKGQEIVAAATAHKGLLTVGCLGNLGRFL